MSRFIGLGQDCPLFDGAMNAQRKLSAIAWSYCAAGLLALAQRLPACCALRRAMADDG